MTLPVNPFFTKELRQFRRHRQTADQCVFATIVYMLAMILLTIGNWFIPDGIPVPRGEWEIPALVWFLTLPHGALCLMAAIYGAQRVFSADHQAGALQEVLALPYSSSQWLAFKLAFPLALTLCAWTWGLPFYSFYLVIKAVSWGTAFKLILLPALVGMGWVLLSVLFVPNHLSHWQSGESEEVATEDAAKQPLNVDAIVRSAMALCAVVVAVQIWSGNITAWLEWRRFYITVIPEAFVWLWLIACFAWAWGHTATGVIEGNESAERRGALFRWSFVVCSYYAVLGLNWTGMEPGRRWLWLAALPVGALALNFLARRGSNVRKEDPWSHRELVWIQKRWDNAVLLKDLRTHTRSGSLRRTAFRSVLQMGVLVACIVAAYYYWGPAAFGSWFMPAWILGSGICNEPIALMSSQWAKEKKSSTWSLLLLTPLTSHDILSGRLRAALLYGWLSNGLGRLLIIPVLLLWVFQRKPHWMPIILACSPLVLTCIILLGFTEGSGTGTGKDAPLLENIVEMLQGAVLLGCAVLVFNAPAGHWAWALAALLFLCNAALCSVFFNSRARSLDNLRRGDMLLENSASN